MAGHSRSEREDATGRLTEGRRQPTCGSRARGRGLFRRYSPARKTRTSETAAANLDVTDMDWRRRSTCGEAKAARQAI